MIFFIRILMATCLFTLLGKANVWLTPSSHATLVVSYRTLLIFSPYFSRYAGSYAILCATLIAIGGVTLLHWDLKNIGILAALLTGLGLSVAGFLIKSIAAETPRGAGWNKVAINMGSLCAGIILFFPFLERDDFFLLCLTSLAVCCIVILWQRKNPNPNPTFLKIKNVNKPSLRQQCAWGLVGMVIGIKLFGVFAVLPQYLLSTHSMIPHWYGGMIFLSSLIIIIFQLPVIKLLTLCVTCFNQWYLPFLILAIGMLLIAMPQYFYAHTVLGAIIWTLLLSLIECGVSYLDVQSSHEGTLLIKETAVGIGGGITVLLMRYLPAEIASVTVGLLGILLLGLAIFCCPPILYKIRLTTS